MIKYLSVLTLTFFMTGCASLMPAPPSCMDNGEDLRMVNSQAPEFIPNDVAVFDE